MEKRFQSQKRKIKLEFRRKDDVEVIFEVSEPVLWSVETPSIIQA